MQVDLKTLIGWELVDGNNYTWSTDQVNNYLEDLSDNSSEGYCVLTVSCINFKGITDFLQAVELFGFSCVDIFETAGYMA